MSSFSDYYSQWQNKNNISNTKSSFSDYYSDWKKKKEKEEADKLLSEQKAKEERQQNELKSKEELIKQIKETEKNASTSPTDQIQKIKESKTRSLADMVKASDPSLSNEYKVLESDEVMKEKYGNLADIKYLEAEINPDKYFFKPSQAFKDGYQFGDLSKTVADTTGDAFFGVTKGIMSIGEGIADLGTYGIAQINDWRGNTERANELRENAKQSAMDELFKPVDKFYKDSVLGGKGDQTAEGIGYVVGMTAIGYVTGGAGASLGMSETTAATIGTTATTFTTAMGNGMSEAYNNGATDDEAWLYGFITGLGESGSELMFGGLGKATSAIGLSKGAGEIDDKIIGSLTKPIKNKMVKTLTQYGLKAAGEGVEEVASAFISTLGKKATYMKEEDIKKIWKDENAAEQFWMGCLTSALAQAPSGVKSVVKGTDYITGRTANEQKVYDTLKKNKTIEYKTQKTIDNMIDEQQTKLKELYGRELTTEEVNKIKEAVNETNQAGKLDIEGTKLDSKENTRIEEEIENDLAEGNLSIETIRDILGEDVDLSKDNLLQRSLYEDSQKYEDYKVELTGNEKVDTFLQSAAEAGVNNTTKTRKRIELISKLVENTDRNYRFVNQEQLKENGYNENANGLNDNGNILLNVNSNKEIVAVVGHETTHLFDSKVNGEYTQEYKDLQNAVKNFLQANGTYETKINEINDTYSKAGINLSEAQIMEEVTADTIGYNLFGDNAEEFIKHLTTNRTIFQKIYDYIKKAVKNIKGYDSEEAKQLQNLKDAFDRVYKTLDTTGVNTDTKYSIQQNNQGQKYVKVDTDQDIFKDKTLKEQKEIAKQYILNNFREKGLIKDENKINVSRKTANEYTNPKTKISNTNLSDKLKASTELDNLLNISEYKYSRDDDGRHIFAKNGWDYYETTFQVGDKTYTGLLNVAKGDKGKLLYDITKIKERANNISVKTESVVNSSSNNSIPSSNEDVNTTTKYSIQNNENNTQDNQGRTLSKEQQEYFKDSKVRDENGNLLTMYHGTPNGGFTTFDMNFRGITTDITSTGDYGKGFYFTPNKQMAEGYSENDTYNKGNKQVYEVYLDIKNPLRLDLLNKISKDGRELIRKYGWHNTTDEMYDEIYAKYGLTREEFEKMDEAQTMLGDNWQDIELSELGFDGIINENQNEYIVFNPEQIKRVDNTNPTSNPDIRYSISDTDNKGRKLTKEQQEYFKDSKILDRNGLLMTVYHGTGEDFNIFDINNISKNTKNAGFYGDGFYFTPIKESARFYGKNIKEVYLDIKNPFSFSELSKYNGQDYYTDYVQIANLVKLNKEWGQIPVKFNSHQTWQDIRNDVQHMLENNNTDEEIDNAMYEKYGEITEKINDRIYNYSQKNGWKSLRDILTKNGYDGIINSDTPANSSEIIAFNANQIKNVDNTSPTDNSDIRYSISNTDNNGRTLSEQQREYFKNSKVRDNDGNLLRMYHGTTADFNVFDHKYSGKSGTGNAYGNGFYFTDLKETGNAYGNKVKEVYLDIKKPIEFNKRTLKINEYKKLVEAINEETNGSLLEDYGGIDNLLLDFKYGGDDYDLINMLRNSSGLSTDRFYEIIRNVTGFDGIKANNANAKTDGNFWVVFNSNQIKNIDNLTPTDNPDIRYSMTQGETDQYWKKLDKSDLEEYNTIESEVGNNGEQQVRTENDRLQEKPMDEVDEEVRPYFERIKELTRNVKKGIAEERKKLNDFVVENVSDLPVSKTKTEKFVRELANNKVMTQDDIRSFLENNNKYVEKDVDEYLQKIRKDIISYNFKLNDAVKSELRYKYDKIPRNIKLNNNSGLSVDQVYQELNTKYPDIFSDKIVNEADQAIEIIDFIRDVNPVIKNEINVLTDNEIETLSNQIYGYKQYFDEVKNYYGQYFLDEKKKIQDLSPRNIEEKNTPKKLTRKMVREQILQEMNITDSDLQAGKDISALNFQLSDPIRVNEKVFGREIGKKINDLTINQTKHNTAEKIRWQNRERNEIYDLGIKARSKESAAVQKYGEKQWVDKNGNIKEYGNKELAQEFPNIKTQEKIKNAAQVIRNKYDTYIEQINDVLTALGYDAIPKRNDYMRHFQELGDVFSKTGVPFNLNDMKAEDLPTDINGLTEFNKPGKNWFAQAQKRYGEKTTYDAITGIDGYLEGAGNIIFHTQDIQNYRAVTSLIRDTFGSTKGFEKLDGLSDTEAQQRIKDIQDSKLSKYVAWLDEQANSLAGKKGAIDRGAERFLGRKAYTFFNTVKKQVGSNMTGLNVRSSLTNLISSTIAAGKTNKIALAKGTISTINNMLHNDGFIDKSDFLTSRFGSDSLSSKMWQKVSNAGQVFMNGTDYFTANIITRSKYYEGLQKGMTENDAIKYADDFASRVMGDRSQGATAEAFNSKTLGLFTQFQLEVNNQWQYMVHDTKMDYQQNSEINGGLKAGATALFQLGQIAAYSYFFNEAFEKLTGSRAAFDPIEIFKTLFGLDDDDEEETFDQRLSKAGAMLVDNIPFGNLITGGGRIPISEAFTGISTLGKKLTNQKDKYGNEITWEDVSKDTLKALPYWVLPTGYSQINKTSKGLSMYRDDLPVAGSYTDSGNLRYTVEDSVGSKIQAGLFGAYANPYAQDYIDSGYKTIDKKNIDEMVGLDMNSTEYRKFKEGLSKAGDKKEDKLKYINSSDLTSSQKNLVANNLDKNSKTKIDMNDYSNYNSYEEYQYAEKNPRKYNVITQIDSYDNYNKYKDDIAKIKEAYSTAEGYSTAERKAQVQSYIDSLDLSAPQKMMLEKEAGGYSIKNYSSYIQEYLDSTDLTESEKYYIWEELFN